ncbi:MAG: PAS domain S-box protein, partial [Firmicutes bacterium]|nr:PAS domain S-box protein [Bacillota bacterium]
GRKKDGSHFWVSLNAQFCYDEEGRIIGTEGIVRDITIRKQAEEERFLIADVIAALSANCDLSELSHKIVNILQKWTECASVGLRFRDGYDYPYLAAVGFSDEFYMCENFLCLKDSFGNILKDENGLPQIGCLCGIVISGKTDPSKPYFTKHGSFWSNGITKMMNSLTEQEKSGLRNRCPEEGFESVLLIPVKISNECYGLLQIADTKSMAFSKDKIEQLERVAGIIATGLAERLAEQALEENRRFLSQIIGSSPIPQFVIDTNHTVTHWNRAMAEYTGIKPEDIIGTDGHWQVFYKEKRPLVADLILDGQKQVLYDRFGEVYKPSTLKEGTFEGLEFFPDLGKKGRWLNFTVAQIKNEYGKIVGVINSLEDVTDKIENQKKLAAVNAELSDFAYRVSHDLKKPINVIRGYSNLLEEQIGEDNDFLRKISDSSERMIRFIDDELKLAKAGLVMASKQEVNLEELMKDLKAPVLKEEANVELIIHSPLRKVTGDRQRLSLVFNNLFQNSVKYRDREKDNLIVEISAAENAKSVTVVFKDNGLGIEGRYLPNIFKPGFTAGNKTGTGFGLAIVKKIIEAHGGSIKVESEGKLKGASFIITLPK